MGKSRIHRPDPLTLVLSFESGDLNLIAIWVFDECYHGIPVLHRPWFPDYFGSLIAQFLTGFVDIFDSDGNMPKAVS
jgi:hypothetical protein